MYNFFVELPTTEEKEYYISGTDYNHAVNVLRMKVGEQVFVSNHGRKFLCSISKIEKDFLCAQVIEEVDGDCELKVDLTLLQGLPKADKLEFIIQKSVELGVNTIIPVEMARSVVKIEEKKKQTKTERWQAISQSAAKQSKRSIIPVVKAPTTLKALLPTLTDFDLLIIPYENQKGMAETVSVLNQIKTGFKVGVIIGPEGGFEPSEIELLEGLPNAKVISLGSRILRTETAAITTLSAIMLKAECL